MPRKPKLPDVWRLRRDNYAQFYADRQHFKALPPETQDQYRRLAEVTNFPHLNLAGGITTSDDDRRNLIMLGVAADLDHWYINRFIVTDAGWDEYIRQFNDLPEPTTEVVIAWIEKLYTPLCTSGELYTGKPKIESLSEV